MSCNPVVLYLYPHYPDAVALRWEMIDSKLPGTFKVWVERSGSPEGEFERLNELPVLNSKEWVHQGQTTEILAKQRFPLYRIVLEYPDGKTFTSNVAGLSGPLPRQDYLIARELNRKWSVRLKQVGIPIIVFKRKHWGEKCDKCIDPATGSKTIDFCEDCYNTKFMGGYYDPIETIGEVVVNAHHTSLDPQGLGARQEYDCQMSIMSHPILTRDDIIVEKLTNIRWITWEMQPLEWKRIPVVQQVRLKQAPPSSVVHRLEYDLTNMSFYADGTYVQPNIGYTEAPWRKRSEG